MHLGSDCGGVDRNGRCTDTFEPAPAIIYQLFGGRVCVTVCGGRLDTQQPIFAFLVQFFFRPFILVASSPNPTTLARSTARNSSMGKHSISTNPRKVTHKAKPIMKAPKTKLQAKTETPGVDKQLAFAIFHHLNKMGFTKAFKSLGEELEEIYGDTNGHVVMGKLTLSLDATVANGSESSNSHENTTTKEAPVPSKAESCDSTTSEDSSSGGEGNTKEANVSEKASSSDSSSEDSSSEDDSDSDDSGKGEAAKKESSDSSSSESSEDESVAMKNVIISTKIEVVAKNNKKDNDSSDSDSSTSSSSSSSESGTKNTKEDTSDSESSSEEDSDDDEETKVKQVAKIKAETKKVTAEVEGGSSSSDSDDNEKAAMLVPKTAKKISKKGESSDSSSEDECEGTSGKEEASSSSSESDESDDEGTKQVPNKEIGTSKEEDTSVSDSSESSSDSSESSSDDDINAHEPPKKKVKIDTEDAKIVTPEESDSDVSDVDVSDVSSVDVSSSDEEGDELSSDDDSSSDESSEDEKEVAARVNAKKDASAKKAKAASAAAAAWTPKAATHTAEIKTIAGSDGAQVLTGGKPFQRVDDNFWGEVAMKDGGAMADNSYGHVFGDGGFGAKSSEKLLQTRGKRFQHEKTKRKRAFNGFARNGGKIEMNSNSTKYSYDGER